MRVIAGFLRGRTIKVPNSKQVRPTTDKNREAIFNFLNNVFDFTDARVCDLYAGSGALGFEALSRGAEFVDFVEQNFKIFKNIQENVNSLNVAESCKVHKSDAVKFSGQTEKEFDLIIADPPFFRDDVYKVFQNIFSRNLLSENGLLIIERSIQTKDKDTEAFGAEPVRRLGDSLIYLFKMKDENK